MGVLNVTPDSFSGRWAVRRPPSVAIAHGRAMVEAGAAVIDVGGDSYPARLRTDRAGRTKSAELSRVIRGLAGQIAAIISVDTSRALVAQAALEAGAHLVNDVLAGRDDPELLPVVAACRSASIILMHMQGRPATMQDAPSYTDVVAEIHRFLRTGPRQPSRGIDIVVDPGIGFGKTVEHNLTLLRQISDLKSFNLPLVVGTSRKGVYRENHGGTSRIRPSLGTAATVAWAVANGADLSVSMMSGRWLKWSVRSGRYNTDRTLIFRYLR